MVGKDARTQRTEVPYVISLDSVSRHFGGVEAVSNVTVNLAPGSVTGLIGPNGAGKSTIVALACGNLRPDSGRVMLLGRDVTGLRPYARARAGLIRTFQTSSEFARLTVLENLTVAGCSSKAEGLTRTLLFGRRGWLQEEKSLVDKARDLAGEFGLGELLSAYGEELSGGQRRILEIMRALMAEPKILVLDEPMAGVNPTTATRIADHLEKAGKEGLTMLLIEHEFQHVARLCDRVIVMARGRVIADGPPLGIRDSKVVRDAYAIG